MKKVLKLMFSFRGRCGRLEFVLILLLNFIVLVVLIPVYATSDPLRPILAMLFVGLFLIPQLAVRTKRWHDMDRSAWLLLLDLIGAPLTMFIHLLVPGTQDPNRFGEPSG